MSKRPFLDRLVVIINMIFEAYIGIMLVILKKTDPIAVYDGDESSINATKTSTIDDRIQKIDFARQSVVDVLDALDEMKLMAENNKIELEGLSKQILVAESEKAIATERLMQARALAELDAAHIRSILKPLPSEIMRERIIGFTIGIAASVSAALIWEFAIKAILVL